MFGRAPAQVQGCQYVISTGACKTSHYRVAQSYQRHSKYPQRRTEWNGWRCRRQRALFQRDSVIMRDRHQTNLIIGPKSLHILVQLPHRSRKAQMGPPVSLIVASELTDKTYISRVFISVQMSGFGFWCHLAIGTYTTWPPRIRLTFDV